MKIFQIIFLAVLIIPFAEIYLLLEVGSVIGAFWTIFLVVFSAALGAWLLRQQGFSTFKHFQESLAQGVIPAYEMIEGPIILLGGALLLTPGFITDIIGFAWPVVFSKKKRRKLMCWKVNFVKKSNKGKRQSSMLLSLSPFVFSFLQVYCRFLMCRRYFCPFQNKQDTNLKSRSQPEPCLRVIRLWKL
jgi:UPF0716 protein FxsA